MSQPIDIQFPEGFNSVSLSWE